MSAELQIPNADRVLASCARFDDRSSVAEQALNELFAQYPSNGSLHHVLLKVVALNQLYSTQILAVYDVADHIYQHREEVDSALAAGSPEVVDKIAKVTISTTGKIRLNYSFATKYCSWHNPTSYPIWDSRVDRYLRSLRRTPFSSFLRPHGELWDSYREFVVIMTAFRDFYGLSSFSFKDIDKFLWEHGAPPGTTLG